jgi:hypothetical protein
MNYRFDGRAVLRLTQLLIKVIAIEKHLQVEKGNIDTVFHEAKQIVDNALNKSSSHLAEIIAELATKSKD